MLHNFYVDRYAVFDQTREGTNSTQACPENLILTIELGNITQYYWLTIDDYYKYHKILVYSSNWFGLTMSHGHKDITTVYLSWRSED